MKLAFSPGSPYVRKVRIAAIELGFIDKIELVPTTVTPTQRNEAYAHDVNPLRKVPALTLDNGQVIVDSFNIVEYFDDLAGGGKLIPSSGAARWKVKTEHSIIQGITDAMLLCRYESGVRPKELFWRDWYDDQWDRAWQGLTRFENSDITTRPMDAAQIALVCTLGYADFRFPDCGWHKAFPKLDAFNKRMLQRESVKISSPPQA